MKLRFLGQTPRNNIRLRSSSAVIDSRCRCYFANRPAARRPTDRLVVVPATHSIVRGFAGTLVGLVLTGTCRRWPPFICVILFSITRLPSTPLPNDRPNFLYPSNPLPGITMSRRSCSRFCIAVMTQCVTARHDVTLLCSQTFS